MTVIPQYAVAMLSSYKGRGVSTQQALLGIKKGAAVPNTKPCLSGSQECVPWLVSVLLGAAV